jgi:hypothetical protein
MMEPGELSDEREFFAEVDAFIASLPEDSGRVQRVAELLPENFHEVLRGREQLRSPSAPPALALPSAADWNWSVIAASTAIAAALAGMLLIWLSADPAEPGSGQAGAPPVPPSTEEMEFVVTIHPDGEADITAQSWRAAGSESNGAELAMEVATSKTAPVGVDDSAEPWFMKPPEAAKIPQVAGSAWVRTSIDHFILAAMQARGIQPVADADRLTLLRRLSYDLTGLPPSPELVERFLHNQSPAAYGSVVDELMATWQFGEHWGGRWLQLVGYDAGVPELWRYREYVIAALNEDKPFDRFLAEQLAGDLLLSASFGERAEAWIGTGFLVTPGDGQAEQQVDRMAAVMLGIKQPRVGDSSPLTPRDWQAMAGIFASTRIDRGLDLHLDPKRFPPANLVEDDRRRVESKRLRGLLASGERRLARAVERRERDRVRRLRAEVADLRSELLSLELAMRDQIVSSGSEFVGARDRQRPVAIGGVARGIPTRMAAAGAGAPVSELAPGRSGRLELAQWLVDPRHPLTARVLVDRMWGELFGGGLIGAERGAGIDREPPRHPELLDYLALKFSSDGWSVKRLLREIVSSRIYQLESIGGARGLAVGSVDDRPWMRSPRVLSDEELHDAVGSVAGWLVPAAPGEGRLFGRAEFGPIEGLEGERAYRAMYLDSPGLVDESLIFEAAVAASRRMLATALERDTARQVHDVFVSTLGREPSSGEAAWAREVIGRAGSLEDGGVLGSVRRPDLLGEQAGYLEGLLPRVTVRLEAGVRPGGRVVPWAMLYHALMMSDDFRQLR